MLTLKETVHPKIYSSFQTCMNVFVLNTKEDILKNEGNSSIFSPTIEVNGAPKQPDYNKISSFVFRTNIHTGLDLLEDE